MSRLILILILILALSAPAMGQTDDSLPRMDFCLITAQMARGVAEARDDGETLVQALNASRKSLTDPDMRKIADNVIMEVHERHDRTPAEMEAGIFVVCMGGTT